MDCPESLMRSVKIEDNRRIHITRKGSIVFFIHIHSTNIFDIFKDDV